MTDMKRITVSLTDELVAAISELQKTDEFRNMPASAIIRMMVERGLKTKEAKA